jgi:uncharacterized membrane protein
MRSLRRIAAAALVFGMILAFLPGKGASQNTQNFTIKSFTADYYLDKNSSQTATLRTIETITAEFPSYDQNHGILRAIPQSYQDHTVSLKIDSVTDENGTPLHYTTSGQNGNKVLKIGDAGTYVHGLKTYKITYGQRNVAAIFSDHDEFYWDVNGDQWQQTFDAITARLHISSDLVPALQDRRTCYFGANGSSDTSGCTIAGPVSEPNGELITFSAKSAPPGENMTMVLGFAPGTFKLGPEIARDKRDRQIKYALIAAGTAAPALLSLIYLFTRWRKYGRDPKGRGVIIPEYQPPKGLNVLTSDYIFMEKLDNKAISALIIELAIRKYITIYEVKDEKRLRKDTIKYKLKLIKDPADLKMEERDVLRMYFTGLNVGTEIDLSKLAAKLSMEAKILGKSLARSLTEAGYFRSNPAKAGSRYSLIGSALIVAAFFLMTSGHILLPGLSVALSGIIFLIFSRYMPSRSDTGAIVNDHMLGLRDYIKLAEADRLNFLQSPQGAEKIQEAELKPEDPQFKVKLFESLLPYAMVFDLEKDWAKQFEDAYKTPPSWYNGNWSTFNTFYLANSLGGFNSVSNTAFTAPHSSGASGFGGGFSGGGGGGGGGGGW